MDFDSLKSRMLDVAVRHPGTGEETGLVIKFVSPHDVSAGPARKILADRQRKNGGAITEGDTIEFIAALAQGWEWGGDARWRGEKPTFSRETLRKFLTEFPIIGVQLNQDLNDNSAFFTD